MWHEYSHVFLTGVWSKMRPNPIFLANASEIPWLDLIQNPCHVPAWKTSIKPGKITWNLVWIWTKLPSICDMKWHGISMRIHAACFTGMFIFSMLSCAFCPDRRENWSESEMRILSDVEEIKEEFHNSGKIKIHMHISPRFA